MSLVFISSLGHSRNSILLSKWDNKVLLFHNPLEKQSSIHYKCEPYLINTIIIWIVVFCYESQ
eukprot:gene13355-9187_t